MAKNLQKKSKMHQDGLKEVIIEVLKSSNECFGAAEISKRSHIFRQGGIGKIKGFNDAIVTGLLMALFDEGKVKRCKLLSKSGKVKKGKGWKLK